MADGALGPSARRRALLVPAAAVVIVGLAVAASAGRSRTPTIEERTEAVASTIRCPACGDLSVADATSTLAVSMRASIERDLRGGQTPEQIRAAFVRRYGGWILLDPGTSGLGVVAWLAPVIAIVVGLGVLVAILRRPSRRTTRVRRRVIA